MQDRALTHLYIYIVREMNDMMMWETPSKTLLRLMMIMSARLWFVCSALGPSGARPPASGVISEVVSGSIELLC